jgi:hypothetical protein
LSNSCRYCFTISPCLFDDLSIFCFIFLSRTLWSADVTALQLTFVFLQWCAFEAASCPEYQTLNEDINFGQHVTAPLKKHFVGCSGASTVTFLFTACLKSSVAFC